MTMTWNAYHFVGATLRDGTSVPSDGVTLRWDGPLKMCISGFHASRKAWQAVEYAPGPILCRVHCTGDVIEGHDKLVCRERTLIERRDATDMLRAYARSCAIDVLHLWNAPDVVREYLETGNERLRTAAGAAAIANQHQRLTRMADELFEVMP
jgi:hypothetical protein